MEISNVKVYDLAESIIASGLPMQSEYDKREFSTDRNELELDMKCREMLEDNSHFKRACRLADNPAGSGHNNFLSGIVVSLNVTATNVWWMQLERYHFVQIVSSMSKMHRLREMLKANKLNAFHHATASYVAGDYIVCSSKHKTSDEEMIYSCPMGLELTARITTNYLQLKTIKNQRKNHKLTEWKTFVEWIDSLPFAKEFIG